jgi:hypothetical protein
MNKRIIINARFDEDLSWCNKLKDLYEIKIMQVDDTNTFFPYWREGVRSYHKRLFSEIVDKGKLNEFLKSTTPGKYPNIGLNCRLLFTYIVENYENLFDITVFVHGDPRHHCENIISQLMTLADDIDFVGFGNEYISDGNGGPYDKCPVAQLYKKLFNKEESPKEFKFFSGSCFAISKNNILQHPKEFYQNALDLTLQECMYPWAFERLFTEIFK